MKQNILTRFLQSLRSDALVQFAGLFKCIIFLFYFCGCYIYRCSTSSDQRLAFFKWCQYPVLFILIDVSKRGSCSLEGDDNIRHRVYYSLKGLLLLNFILYFQQEEFNSYNTSHTFSIISALPPLFSKAGSSKML